MRKLWPKYKLTSCFVDTVYFWNLMIKFISLLLPYADKAKNNEIYNWCFHFHLGITATYNMHHCQAKSPNPKSKVLSLRDLNKRKKNSYKWHATQVERQKSDFLCLKVESKSIWGILKFCRSRIKKNTTILSKCRPIWLVCMYSVSQVLVV